MASLADSFDARANSVGALRFVAASMVIVGHSFPFGGFGEDPLKLLTHNQIAIGRWPVDVFFVLSGFLLARSLENGPLLEYAINRILRIYPAFLVCLALSAFAVPAAFGVPPGYKYFLRSAPLLLGVEHQIPGLFMNNEVSDVNSALWTLPYEIYCYITLAGLYFLCGLWKKSVTLALFLLLTAGFWLVIVAHPGAGSLAAVSSPFRLLTFFYAGVAAYVWRDKICISHMLGFTAAAGLVLATIVGRYFFEHGAGLFYMAAPFGLTYLTLYLAAKLPFHRFNNVIASGIKIDLSYGIYIYGTLVLQCLVSQGYDARVTNVPVFIAFAFGLTLVLAAMSWFLIEKPAMDQRGRASRFVRSILRSARTT